MFTQKGNFISREHFSSYYSPSVFLHCALRVPLNVPPSASCLVPFSKLRKVPVCVSYLVSAEFAATQTHWRTNKPHTIHTHSLDTLYLLERNLLILGMVAWGSFHNHKHSKNYHEITHDSWYTWITLINSQVGQMGQLLCQTCTVTLVFPLFDCHCWICLDHDDLFFNLSLGNILFL